MKSVLFYQIYYWRGRNLLSFIYILLRENIISFQLCTHLSLLFSVPLFNESGLCLDEEGVVEMIYVG